MRAAACTRIVPFRFSESTAAAAVRMRSRYHGTSLVLRVRRRPKPLAFVGHTRRRHTSGSPPRSRSGFASHWRTGNRGRVGKTVGDRVLYPADRTRASAADVTRSATVTASLCLSSAAATVAGPRVGKTVAPAYGPILQR